MEIRPMESPTKSVAIYSLLVICVVICIVCGAGWFQARQESRQVREMNRHLFAEISKGQAATVVSDNVPATHRDSAGQSPQVEDGELILPPGLGQEFPELLLPMTTDRAVNFERRQLSIPPLPPGRTGGW
jgi:hypothetical protein